MGAGYLNGYYNDTDAVDLGLVSSVSTTHRPRRQASLDGSSILLGGVQTKKTWIYDGKKWVQKADMSIARDRPACSIVQDETGQV